MTYAGTYFLTAPFARKDLAEFASFSVKWPELIIAMPAHIIPDRIGSLSHEVVLHVCHLYRTIKTWVVQTSFPSAVSYSHPLSR